MKSIKTERDRQALFSGSSMRKLLIFGFVLTLCSVAFADYRIWQDRDGNEIEAEFVRELFDKVTLRKKDGSEVRMTLDEFSDLDQKYFRVMVPPKIEVDVQVRDKYRLYEYNGARMNPETLDHRVVVRVEKKSKRPFTSRLYAEIYFLGEEVDDNGNKILVSKQEFDFIFPEGRRSSSYIFKAGLFSTVRFTDQYTRTTRGEVYEGYILLIRDALGNDLLIKTTIAGDWAKDPQVIRNLNDLWVRGSGSIRSRHFDKKTGKKVELFRPSYR